MKIVIEIVISLMHLHTPESLAAGQLAGAFGVNLAAEEPYTWLQIGLEASPFVVGVLVGLLSWRHTRKGGAAPHH
jgi:hypothetical protein